ncbi:zinc-binding dehydrogenase [Streptomyces sp. NPDC001407]|uniref:zinc-binding dehydrogenase n=1 Tax=Streptomyces sp. NPDC001407 TaxID=3364573 RepID=UPI00367D97BC
MTHPRDIAPDEAEATRPADAVLWGLTRCLVNEQPDLGCRRLSLNRSGTASADTRRLAQELFHPTAEDEIILSPQGRFVLREQPRPSAVPATDGLAFALRIRDAGLSYRLAWEETERPEPGPGEVLIEVRAAALNYRDVMRSLGLLPAEAAEGTPWGTGVGLECAGTVAACGPGVTGLRPGDRVAGTSPASLASHTVTQAGAVRPMPDDMTYAEAATMPVAYATVHYSLITLARLQPGETLLVHGAAGGVGPAALRYATACGAHVIATIGSDLKRDFLRALGVQHVLDSRSLHFAGQVMEITHGQGVDVVLNSLAGEAITRGLELLRPGGRFLELGKRDIYENKPLPLRPFANNIAFFAVDLTKVLNAPSHIEALRQDVQAANWREAWCPLPHSVFPAARVTEAFTLLQHSRHIGKVVVAFDPLDEPPLVERGYPDPRLDPEGTYLITGGTSGFGAATAHWLAGLGMQAIRPAEALAHAGELLQAGAETALVARFDWGRIAALPLVSSPRLSGLVPSGAVSGRLSREELLRKLGQMTSDEALEYVTHTLTVMLAGVLHMDPDQIDPHHRVDSYGLDSLMATELLVDLQQRYEVNIPPLELLRSANGTLADIAQTVYLRLGLASSTPVTAELPHRADAPTAGEGTSVVV